MPLVSICLPTLNARRFLAPRLDSIFSQTVTDWELIACDSYSDDGTWEMLQQYQHDPRVRLFQVPRDGLFAGWNECLKRAQGDYVYIATADDTASRDLLARLVGVLERFRDVDICICDFAFIDECGMEIGPTQGIPGAFYKDCLAHAHRRNGLMEFLVHTETGTSWTTVTSMVFRASLLRKVGLFRTDVGPGEAYVDRLWAMKTALQTDSIYIPEKLATWRKHEGQASAFEHPGWRRRNWVMTGETIDECADLIPINWKNDREWRDKLLWGMRQYYLEGYHLNRIAMRRDPLGFLKGCGRAVLHEPGYFLRRLRSGFSWLTSEMQDPHEHVRRLAAEWTIPGPVSVEA